jgi:hypothetical protein
MSVSCVLMGGLGNQMFQIFNALSYSIDNSLNVFFPRNLTSNVRPTYWDTVFNNISEKISVPDNTFYRYNEKSFNYKHIPFFSKNIILCGYYQSYKYFIHNVHEIMNMLKLHEKKQTIRSTFPYEYTSTISLHFRIGDYISLQDFHPLLNYKYYVDAIKKIIELSETKTWNVLYFYESNDIDIVNEMIGNIVMELDELEISFTSIDTNMLDWEQLLCMSLCKHKIIANSSYSLMSAHIACDSEQIVTYPSKWFGVKIPHNTCDMFREEWIKINI